MSVTLTNLRDQVYDILRESADSSAYPYTLVDSLLNSAQMRICSGKIVNTFNGTKILKGSLPFLEKRKFYDNILSTGLSSAATLGATTLTGTSTTDFPSTGAIWLNGNTITYTGKTATTFTGCTNVLFPFISGTKVYPMFALPTDLMSTIEVSYNNAIPIPYKRSKDIYRDQVEMMKGGSNYNYIQDTNGVVNTGAFPLRRAFYTIVDGAYFLPYYLDNNGGMFVQSYEKIPTALTSPSDVATISVDTYALNTIAYLATGEVLFNRGEEARASQLLTFAYGQIQEMYAYYNNQGNESMDGQSVEMEKNYLNL